MPKPILALLPAAWLTAALLAPAAAQTTTPIGLIQGSGAAAAAGTYTVEGVVTAVYAGLNPAGFYVQNDAATADNDPATSDALFVVQPAPAVQPGDRVRVAGTVQEDALAPSFGQAVLVGPVVTALAAGQARPAFVLVNNAAFSAAAAEAYEGMLVQFAAPLTVVNVDNLKARGELTLSTDGLVYQPTQVVDPNDNPAAGTSSTGAANVAAVNAYAAANAAKAFLLLDDGSAAANPSPTPYLDPQLQTVRVGSTAAGLRGVLGYGGGRWRVQPLPGPADAPALAVTRPAVPTFGGTALDLKLVSFNVLNYFNGDGAGGGFPTARGAATLADFQRQRSKIVAALAQLNADVVGLTEIENDGTGPSSALLDLLAGLNQQLGAGTYAFVDDGATRQPGNSDLIRCAILYKPAAVQPVGPVVLGVNSVFERPPVAQVFRTVRPAPATADTFAFVVNHFKSKASGTGLDADQGDGQGRSNNRRRLQAQQLAQFLNATVASAAAGRVVSVGDYNAYYEEDPLDILRAAGLVIPAASTRTSYVFSGQSGALDHAVFSARLAPHARVEPWNINSPEPEFLQYNVAGPATAVGSPFRSSDHDPVLIGLNFSRVLAAAPRVASTSPVAAYPNPAPATAGFALADLPAGSLVVSVVSAQGQQVLTLRGTGASLQAELRARTARLTPGLYLLRVRGAGLDRTLHVVKE